VIINYEKHTNTTSSRTKHVSLAAPDNETAYKREMSTTHNADTLVHKQIETMPHSSKLKIQTHTCPYRIDGLFILTDHSHMLPDYDNSWATHHNNHKTYHHLPHQQRRQQTAQSPHRGSSIVPVDGSAREPPVRSCSH
jgi:hypothetical protein